jgi:hypothetical protein
LVQSLAANIEESETNFEDIMNAVKQVNNTSKFDITEEELEEELDNLAKAEMDAKALEMDDIVEITKSAQQQPREKTKNKKIGIGSRHVRQEDRVPLMQ